MRILFLISFLILVFFCSCQANKRSGLVIATAANVQFAMDELIHTFTNETGIPCEMVLGSSGKLTAQIREGAPFDVFVSADVKYPEELYKKGLTTAAPDIYAYGKLVLWSLMDEIPDLTGDQVRHIAIANPKTAPYGVAAIEALRYDGIYAQVRDKLVFGESISQTNQFIISKTAEVGFTAKSVVLSPEMKGVGHWKEVQEGTFTPIAQGVVLLNRKHSLHPDSRQFYQFLFSEKARIILEAYGYQVPR
jgi:molybdate transport system substrate-binding protein